MPGLTLNFSELSQYSSGIINNYYDKAQLYHLPSYLNTFKIVYNVKDNYLRAAGLSLSKTRVPMLACLTKLVADFEAETATKPPEASANTVETLSDTQREARYIILGTLFSLIEYIDYAYKKYPLTFIISAAGDANRSELRKQCAAELVTKKPENNVSYLDNYMRAIFLEKFLSHFTNLKKEGKINATSYEFIFSCAAKKKETHFEDNKFLHLIKKKLTHYKESHEWQMHHRNLSYLSLIFYLNNLLCAYQSLLATLLTKIDYKVMTKEAIINSADKIELEQTPILYKKLFREILSKLDWNFKAKEPAKEFQQKFMAMLNSILLLSLMGAYFAVHHCINEVKTVNFNAGRSKRSLSRPELIAENRKIKAKEFVNPQEPIDKILQRLNLTKNELNTLADAEEDKWHIENLKQMTNLDLIYDMKNWYNGDEEKKKFKEHALRHLIAFLETYGNNQEKLKFQETYWKDINNFLAEITKVLNPIPEINIYSIPGISV